MKDKVLHYIEVMARPMVMYQNHHPIKWTPAYMGGKVVAHKNFIKNRSFNMLLLQADSFTKNKGGQLMTSVTTPVFERRNGTVGPLLKNYACFSQLVLQMRANLLGVVGTDVSIDEIKKLVPPYKARDLKIYYYII